MSSSSRTPASTTAKRRRTGTANDGLHGYQTHTHTHTHNLDARDDADALAFALARAPAHEHVAPSTANSTPYDQDASVGLPSTSSLAPSTSINGGTSSHPPRARMAAHAHAHAHPHPPQHPPLPQLMGSTSTANGLRRSARNLRSVNEVVGGKMQEVFVLDDEEDDEAPPSRPLAADLHNGARDPASGLAKLNGAASSTRGKRKAQASPPPPPLLTHSVGPSSAAASAYGQVPEASSSSSGRKRRREQPAAQPANGLSSTQGHYPYPSAASPSRNNNNNNHAAAGAAVDYGSHSHWSNAGTTSAGYPTVPDWAGSSTHQQTHQPASNYRGGYAAGAGAVAPPIASATNGHATRQHILESADAAQKRFLYERSYQQAPYRQDATQPQAVPQPVDDKDGHYIVREGEWISDPRGGEQRYKILSQLGQGTFGKVVECYDRHLCRYVAIKVIRAVQKYRDASQIEIRVLKTLSENDPRNENKCIHLLDTFSYRNHVCIVSELLGKSVFDFLKDNQFNPFPPAHIWSFAQQLLKSVAFLHRLNLVHTDLKPENILLVSSDYDYQPVSRRANSRRKRVLKDTDIRLIDFGSATFNDEYHSQVVSTRHYRAPEIILNMGWSFPCDAWSIGCILIEFYTGEALFQTHDNLEHLAMMEQVLGPMPDGFRRKAETFKAEYFRGGRLDFPNSETPKGSKKYVSGMRKLGDILSKATTWKKHNERFLHLLKRLLEFDPTKRIRVSEALHHPYFELMPSEIPP